MQRGRSKIRHRDHKAQAALTWHVSQDPAGGHVRKPNIWKIRSWQRRAKETVSRLKRQGYAIAVQDKSIFTFDPIRQKKYWSPVGVPVITEYGGSHKKTVVYGVLTADGRQFFRT